MKRRTLIVDNTGQNKSSLDLHALLKLLKEELELTQYPQRPLDQCDWRDPPEIIIQNNYSGYEDYLLWQKLKYLWGDLPFLIGLCFEPGNMGKGMLNHTVSFEADSGNNTQLNNILFGNMLELSQLIKESKYTAQSSINSSTTEEAMEGLKKKTPFLSYHKKSENPEFLNWFNNLRKRPKTHFCNFIYSRRNLKFGGVRNRNKLCRQISKYKKVDCAARVMNNTNELYELEKRYKKGHPDLPFTESSGHIIAKYDYISKYKFTIAGENHSSPHYITEKIMFPLLVGSIPIYWGCKEINKYVNPKAFINCNDYNSFKEVVNRVKQVDQDQELYNEYITAPVFLPDSLFYEVSLDRVKTKLRNLSKLVDNHIVNKQNERAILAEQKEKPIWTKNKGEANIANFAAYQLYKKKYRGWIFIN